MRESFSRPDVVSKLVLRNESVAGLVRTMLLGTASGALVLGGIDYSFLFSFLLRKVTFLSYFPFCLVRHGAASPTFHATVVSAL